jgi:hypothetical protein
MMLGRSEAAVTTAVVHAIRVHGSAVRRHGRKVPFHWPRMVMLMRMRWTTGKASASLTKGRLHHVMGRWWILRRQLTEIATSWRWISVRIRWSPVRWSAPATVHGWKRHASVRRRSAAIHHAWHRPCVHVESTWGWRLSPWIELAVVVAVMNEAAGIMLLLLIMLMLMMRRRRRYGWGGSPRRWLELRLEASRR